MSSIQRRKNIYLKYIHAEIIGSSGESYISKSSAANEIIYNGVYSLGKFLNRTYKPKVPNICNPFFEML